MTPTFLWHAVSAVYCQPFGKVWLSSVCWPPCPKPGNEVECRIYGGYKRTSSFKPFVDRSSCTFEATFRLPAHLPNCLYHVLFRRYRPLKLPLSCKVVEKCVLAPDLYRERIPQISDTHFQIALTSGHNNTHLTDGQTDGLNCDSNTVRCITCSRTVIKSNMQDNKATLATLTSADYIVSLYHSAH